MTAHTDPRSPLNSAIQALATHPDPFERARMEAMTHAYAWVWDAVDCEPLAVEKEFVAPFIRPDGVEDPDWLLSGKIDLILSMGGRTLIVDHKTTASDISPGAPFREQLVMHRQPPHYFLGARALGYEPDAFVFDVLGKIKIDRAIATPENERKYRESDGALYANQRITDETPEEHFERAKQKLSDSPGRYFAQIEVHRNTDEMTRYIETLYADSTLIDTVREYHLATPNEVACYAYNRPCEYRLGCSGVASFDDPTLYQRKRAHEELDSSVQPGKRLLTVSRLTSFNSCRKKHMLRYEHELSPVRRDPTLEFGTMIHKAAEAYWKARM